MAASAARSLPVFGLVVGCLAFSPPALAQDNQAGVTDRGKQFFSEAKAFRETPGWKKLEQVVAIATKLSGEAATQAEAAQHQRVIDARLETPAETAKYLADLAFNQTKGSDGPTGIVVEYTTHPGAVAAAAQLMPPAGEGASRRDVRGESAAAGPEQGHRAYLCAGAGRNGAASGAQGRPISARACGWRGAASGRRARRCRGARRLERRPLRRAAGRTGGISATRAKRSGCSRAGGPASARADCAELRRRGGDFAPRAAVPAGYEPVAGGSRGCPTN